MTTTVQIRIDQKTKTKAQKAFKGMGIDLSSGVKLFLTQVGNTGEIPFRIFTADNLPEAAKKRLVREAKYAMKHGKRYVSAKEMFDDILGRK
ncbi:MAG TPA: type II toxin-antitoxin system RelB/DinJ family antitoxin [Candidatus Paceibacterota bacterium]